MLPDVAFNIGVGARRLSVGSAVRANPDETLLRAAKAMIRQQAGARFVYGLHQFVFDKSAASTMPLQLRFIIRRQASQLCSHETVFPAVMFRSTAAQAVVPWNSVCNQS